MREHEFRAWDGKVMTKDFYLEPDGSIFCDTYQTVESQPNSVGFEDFIVYKKDYILLEYTGRKDKNGTKIYEGDIFRAPHCFGPGGWGEMRIGSVPTDHHMDIQWQYWDLKNLEVIGNIYENPELLERL